MTNFGTNDPLAVKLWSKSFDFEALKYTDIFPLIGDDANSVIHRKPKTSTPQGERFSAPQAAIRAELIADDSCSALGMTVRGFAPVLALCRLLVEAGHAIEYANFSLFSERFFTYPILSSFPSQSLALANTTFIFFSLGRVALQTNEVHMNRLAYPLPEAACIAGVSGTRIFEAVPKQELTIRKAGRASIVTHDALLAWINSLPVKGRRLDGSVSAGM